MKYDVRCLACDGVYVATLGEGHEPGETVRLAHTRRTGQCGHYGEHRIERVLTGVEAADE